MIVKRIATLLPALALFAFCLPASAQTDLTCADIQTEGDAAIEYESNFGRDDFENAVRRCVEYIEAGDIFQVVISQRLQLPIAAEPFEIYRTLRVVNPSPFMFFLRTPETTLVGSSPSVSSWQPHVARSGIPLSH